MLFVLTLDLSKMLCYYIMYAHGKLDLKLIQAMPKQSRKIIQSEGVDGSKLINELCDPRPQMPRKIVTTSFGEKCLVVITLIHQK